MSLITTTVALVPNGYPDIHWSLISAPTGVAVPGIVYSNATTGTSWVPNSSTSQWVGPTPLANASNPIGNYVYQASFDLTGLTVSTVSLSGYITAADTAALRINGNLIVNAGEDVTTFTVATSALVSGVNTIQVTVVKAGSSSGPTGFQLNISGTATQTSTSTTVNVPIFPTGVFSFSDPSITPPPVVNVNSYLGLITSEHANKPKFMALVQALTQAFVDLQNTYLNMPLDFYLATAEGSQLDFLGQWINAPRALNVPIGSVTSMDDNTYRLVLRAQAAANSWDSTLPTAAAILNSVFAGTGTNLFIQDNQDMSQTIGIVGVLPSTLLLNLIEQNYLGLKPAGVRQNVVESSVVGAPIFGFDVENQFVSGCDVGAWGTVYTGS